MKMEFEGKLDAIIADMIGALSMLGFRLMPKEDEPPEREFVPKPSRAEAKVVDFEEPKKQRGRPRKSEEVVEEKPYEAEATVEDVKNLMEDDAILNTAREDPDPTEELESDPTYMEASQDAIALHKLKEDTLKQLRNLYISGKGPFVRQLLAKHGHGALVFPEVDAKHFPGIKADMDRGVLQ